MASADFELLPGNEELKLMLSGAVRNGTLGHAYIIEGTPGGGTLSFAVEIAKAQLCRSHGKLPCGECEPCKKIAAGTHPDIIIVDSEGKAAIGVDAIRRIRADACIIPSESDHKFYIIDGADKMTVEAQNALLLSLEEPPKYVHYLLLCADPSPLLETIRSRAPSLHICACSRSELESYLFRAVGSSAKSLKERDPDSWDELIVSSGGDPDTAKSLLDGSALPSLIKRKREAERLLSLMLSGKDEAILEVSAMRRMKRDEAITLLLDFERALRDMLLAKKAGKFSLFHFTSVDKASRFGSEYPARTLAASIDAVRDSSAAILANASVATTLLTMTIRIKNS